MRNHNVKTTALFNIVVGSLLCFALTMFCANPAGAAQVSIAPDLAQASVGDTVTISIALDDVADLSGFQAGIAFDPAAFAVSEVRIANGFDTVVANQFDNVVGGAMAAGLALAAPRNGTVMPLAEIDLTLISAGTHTVALSNVILGKLGGDEISSTTAGGSIAVIISLAKLNVAKTGTGSGTVTSSPAGINCGGSCMAAFTSVTTVTLLAEAAVGSTFAGWTGDADCTDGQIDMNGNRNCTATFTLNTYNVTPSAGTGGSISPNTPQMVSYGSTTSFVITPDPGYSIDTVVGCSGTRAGNIYTTGAITGDCAVIASFVDTTPPNAPSVSGPSSPTNDATPTWTWTPGGGGNGNYLYQLDSTGWNATTSTTFTSVGDLSSGSHTLFVRERDDAGNWSDPGYKTIEVDVAGPTIALSSLSEGSVTRNMVLNLTGSVTDVNGLGVITLDLNTTPTSTLASSFNTALLLQAGANTIAITADDGFGNQSTANRTVVYNTAAPKLTVTAPSDNSTTVNNIIDVTGTMDNGSTVDVSVNGGAPQSAVVSSQSFTVAAVSLAPGMNTIEVIATNATGSTSSVKRTVVSDIQGVTLNVTQPNEDAVVLQKKVIIEGTVADAPAGATVSLAIAGTTYTPLVSAGTFSQTVTLPSENEYAAVVTVKDSGGNPLSTVQRNILYYTVAAPTSLSFGNQLINTGSAAKIVTVSNLESAPLLISGFTLGGKNPGQFSYSSNCPISGAGLVTGATCTVSVMITPTTTGAKNATLAINLEAPAASQVINLSGTGVAPVAAITPASLTYGDQLVSTASTTQYVSVKNTGTAALKITGIALGGTNPFQFASSTTCPIGGAGLATGATCTVNMTFKPTVTGAKSASLAVNVAAPATSALVALTGNCVAPIAVITPASLAYGDQLVSTTSTTRTVTVKNTGTGSLKITGIVMGGTNPFQFASSTTCPIGGAGLASGANCTVSVTFKPTTTGAKSSSLAISVASPAASKTVTLTGTGVFPIAAITPSSLAYGDQLVSTTSTTRTVTVKNTGTGSLKITSIVMGGTNPVSFSSSSTCPINGAGLASGATCTVSVTFKPPTTGAKSASLAISVASPAVSKTVTLTGTGVAPASEISPASLAYGDQLVSTTSTTRTVTVKNTGTGSLKITGIVMGGTNPVSFSSSSTCPINGAGLASGATCTVSVTFKPPTTGAKSASLAISVASPAVSKTVTLTGTGVAPASEISPSSLSFGNQLVSTASVTQTVTVMNTGTAAMKINSIALGGTNPFNFSSSSTCPIGGAGLASGATCTVSVNFKPTSTGAKSAALAISVASPAASKTVTLTGTGQ